MHEDVPAGELPLGQFIELREVPRDIFRFHVEQRVDYVEITKGQMLCSSIVSTVVSVGVGIKQDSILLFFVLLIVQLCLFYGIFKCYNRSNQYIIKFK